MKTFKIIGLLCVSVLTLFSTTTFASDTFDATQKTAIQTIIHDYLVSNPEILVEASKALQQKQLDAMQSNALKGIMANKDLLFASDGDPVAGNLNGKVTLVEFFDYQCPHCVEMMPIINTLIRTNSELRVVFKEFPIFGNVSSFAARAALASAKQGKYFAFHDAIMNARKRLSKDIILQIAKNTGIDIDKLQTDMRDETIEKTLSDNRDLAKALQLVGTPAFVVGPTDTGEISENNTSFVAGQTTEAVLQSAIDKA